MSGDVPYLSLICRKPAPSRIVGMSKRLPIIGRGLGPGGNGSVLANEDLFQKNLHRNVSAATPHSTVLTASCPPKTWVNM